MFYGMEDSITHSPRRNKVRRAKAANRPSKFRERLLEVGARLFVERGISNVSVEELIDAADVSRATFYGFFANKNELVVAIGLGEDGIAVNCGISWWVVKARKCSWH